MNRYLRSAMAIAACLAAGNAMAEVPLFAAKCPTGITADSSAEGKIYINGKVAKVIKRPDGQISANSHGVWVDITPQGDQPPLITYTGKDKSVGRCEVLSFKASGSGATGGSSAGSPNYDRPVGGVLPAGSSFSAGSMIQCARGHGGALMQCDVGVVREGHGNGFVMVFWPDAGSRVLYFENGTVVRYDQSEADGGARLTVTRSGDEQIVTIGDTRFVIFDALIFGG